MCYRKPQLEKKIDRRLFNPYDPSGYLLLAQGFEKICPNFFFNTLVYKPTNVSGIYLSLFLPPHILKNTITTMAQVPEVEDLTLAGFLNRFRAYRQLVPADDQPEPDMVAARYALTGLSRDSQHVAGINTVRDLLGPRGTLPFIRRDFDSLIGFSADIPVSKNVTYFPNPSPTRTLNKSVHVIHNHMAGNVVCRLRSNFLIELTNKFYPITSFPVRPSWTTTAFCPTPYPNIHLLRHYHLLRVTFLDCHAL